MQPADAGKQQAFPVHPFAIRALHLTAWIEASPKRGVASVIVQMMPEDVLGDGVSAEQAKYTRGRAIQSNATQTAQTSNVESTRIAEIAQQTVNAQQAKQREIEQAPQVASARATANANAAREAIAAKATQQFLDEQKARAASDTSAKVVARTAIIRLRGFSMLNREGAPLYDAAANAGYVETMRAELAPDVKRVEVDAHINDAEFADATVQLFLALRSEKG